VTDKPDYFQMTAHIVAAYVGRSPVPAVELPDLVRQVHRALEAASAPAAAEAPPPAPAVPIRNSITQDYLVCLEDGLKFKSLKRHLRTRYDMSPDQYRAKWGLAKNYPMVAPNYAATRADLARRMGLGKAARERASAAKAARRKA
jgi:predicted transcriptional regulator